MTEPTSSRSGPANPASPGRLGEPALGYWEELAATLGNAWNRFWFTPVDPLPLSLLRMGVGALTVVYFLSLTQDLALWFAADGLLPLETIDALFRGGPDAPTHRFSIFYGILSPNALYVTHWLCVAGAVLFTAGALTRISGALTAVALLSYVHRAPLLAGPVEPVLGMLLIYLVIGPSGRYFSVDAWLLRRNQKEAASDESSLTANIALRLMQVHLAALVLTMGLAKLNSLAWWEGDAMWQILAQTISRPLDLTKLRSSVFLLNAWTHAIVYFEFLFPVLIWSRLARPLLLAIGAVLWISIGVATGMLLFSAAMILASLAFVPGETWRRRGVNPR